MLRLASVFYIDIAAFCVMSNHYHIVLHVRRKDALDASPKSIVERALQLVSGNEVISAYLKDENIEPHKHEQLNTFVNTWRNRLFNISWFMKILNEGVARRANREDECKGHFWEARYSSQALLDEKALLSCMAYVDLNPIRAGLAASPEKSDHTSIQLRIDHQAKATQRESASQPKSIVSPNTLMAFSVRPSDSATTELPFCFTDYFELVDWTGRLVRDSKSSRIRDDLPPILQRLNIDQTNWFELSTHFEKRFRIFAGTLESIKSVCQHFGMKRTINRANSKLLFGSNHLHSIRNYA